MSLFIKTPIKNYSVFIVEISIDDFPWSSEKGFSNHITLVFFQIRAIKARDLLALRSININMTVFSYYMTTIKRICESFIYCLENFIVMTKDQLVLESETCNAIIGY